MSTAEAIVEVADYWQWDALAHERGWTDGLPVAPPTEDRVQAILDHLDRDEQSSLGTVGPAYGLATIEQVAIQCAMAGCAPEHAPVVVAAVEAMLEPEFNLTGVQSTTNACAPLAIVSGPIVERLDFNASDGAMGGGSHANAAVGRALRLVMWNIGQAYPGGFDKASIGQPAKYAFATAENRVQSPWLGIQTDFGLDEQDSAVTVFACQSPFPLFVPGDAERILRVVADTLPASGVNMFHAAGQFLLVLSVKPAQELASAGYSKEDVRRWIFDHARFRLGDLRRAGVLDDREAHTTYWGHGEDDVPDLHGLGDDELLPMVRTPQDIHLLVAGNDAQWWLGFCPGWGNYGGLAVAKAIREAR